MITKYVQLDLFESLKPDGFVFWLKLPSYQIPWMYSEFGFPCCIPDHNELHWGIARGIIKNTGGDRICDVCMTASMWRERTDMPDDARCLWVPVALPERIYRGGVHLRPNGKWQLKRAAAVDVREEIRHQFWHSWTSYYQDRIYHAAANGEHVTMDRCLQDWMYAHGISPDEEDVIKRQWRRDRQRETQAARARINETNFHIRERVDQVLQDLRRYKQSGRANYKRLADRIRRKNAK